MDTTHATLLERVRDRDDAAAWSQFYAIYSRLILSYARARGLNQTNAEELVGECMESLARHMRSFEYDPARRRFRTYLRTIVISKIVDMARRNKLAVPLDADRLSSSEPGPDELWERHWEFNHLLYCWEQIQGEVPAHHADAFRLSVLNEWPAKNVAQELGLTVDNVYQIRSRLTQMLRLRMDQWANA